MSKIFRTIFLYKNSNISWMLLIRKKNKINIYHFDGIVFIFWKKNEKKLVKKHKEKNWEKLGKKGRKINFDFNNKISQIEIFWCNEIWEKKSKISNNYI